MAVIGLGYLSCTGKGMNGCDWLREFILHWLGCGCDWLRVFILHWLGYEWL